MELQDRKKRGRTEGRFVVAVEEDYAEGGATEEDVRGWVRQRQMVQMIHCGDP